MFWSDEAAAADCGRVGGVGVMELTSGRGVAPQKRRR